MTLSEGLGGKNSIPLIPIPNTTTRVRGRGVFISQKNTWYEKEIQSELRATLTFQGWPKGELAEDSGSRELGEDQDGVCRESGRGPACGWNIQEGKCQGPTHGCRALGEWESRSTLSKTELGLQGRNGRGERGAKGLLLCSVLFLYPIIET